jgi:hypothetical protein
MTTQVNNNRNLRLHVLNTNSDAGHLNNNENLEQSSFNPYVSQDRRGEDISLDKEKIFELD